MSFRSTAHIEACQRFPGGGPAPRRGEAKRAPGVFVVKKGGPEAETIFWVGAQMLR